MDAVCLPPQSAGMREADCMIERQAAVDAVCLPPQSAGMREADCMIEAGCSGCCLFAASVCRDERG